METYKWESNEEIVATQQWYDVNDCWEISSTRCTFADEQEV